SQDGGPGVRGLSVARGRLAARGRTLRRARGARLPVRRGLDRGGGAGEPQGRFGAPRAARRRARARAGSGAHRRRGNGRRALTAWPRRPRGREGRGGEMAEIGILGNGVAANLAAAYFRKTFPDLGVAVIGRNPPRRPIVCESLVEVSTLFIRELGLGPLLIERHHPKYGLTYYYKQKLEDPSDRRYVVDEAPALPPFPSFEVNRFTFDRDLRACNAAAGVTQLEDRIVDVEIVKGAHRVLSAAADGSKRETVCRWLVDATGRSR